VIHHYTNKPTDNNELTTLQLEQKALESSLSELSARYKAKSSVIVLDLIEDTEGRLQTVSQAINKLQDNVILDMPNFEQVYQWMENFEGNRKVIKECLQQIIDKVTVTKIPMEKGHTFRFDIESGEFNVSYQMTPCASLSKLPAISINFTDRDYSNDEVVALSVAYGAGYKAIVDGYMFELFKGNLGRTKVWREYEQVCKQRIAEREA
jgi:hypothetical protein